MNLPAISFYWKCWGGILAVAAVIKVIIALFWPATNTSWFFFIYIVGVWLPIMVLNYVEGRALTNFIRESQKDRWAEVSRKIGQTENWHNGFKYMKFVYSSDDFGDPEIHLKKLRHRSFIKFVLVAFFAFPVAAGLLSI